MTGRPQAIARKDLCALGKVPAESRGAFSKFFHPETSSYALHNSRGCLHSEQHKWYLWGCISGISL